jgi:beta-glucosidase
VENTRLGIPVMFHEESLHGNQAKDTTVFPTPLAMANSWNEALMTEVYSHIAEEVRSRGGHEVLAPVLDLTLDPRWGRSEETMAVEIAKQADAVILMLGGNEAISKEAWAANHMGDLSNLDLMGNQDELVDAIKAIGKPTAAFVFNGPPLSIAKLDNEIPAIVYGFYLGQESGYAVAETIFGENNPTGKLSISISRSVGHLPVYYYHKPSARRGYNLADITPLYSFGHGLSYTNFAYKNLKISQSSMKADGSATVTVDVTNTGKRVGDEIVQLYIHDLVSTLTRPVKELKDFARISLNAGETKTVSFKITDDKLKYLDENMKEIVELGEFEIMVGGSSLKTDVVKLTVVK